MGKHLSWAHTCHGHTPVMGTRLSWAHACHGHTPVMGTHLSWAHACHGHTPVMGTRLSWAHACHGHTPVMGTRLSWAHACRGHTPVVGTRLYWAHACRGHTPVVGTRLSWAHACHGHTPVMGTRLSWHTLTDTHRPVPKSQQGLKINSFRWKYCETNKVKKEHYLIKQDYSIQMFDKIFFFKYRTREIKATETITYLNWNESLTWSKCQFNEMCPCYKILDLFLIVHVEINLIIIFAKILRTIFNNNKCL